MHRFMLHPVAVGLIAMLFGLSIGVAPAAAVVNHRSNPKIVRLTGPPAQKSAPSGRYAMRTDDGWSCLSAAAGAAGGVAFFGTPAGLLAALDGLANARSCGTAIVNSICSASESRWSWVSAPAQALVRVLTRGRYSRC